eukprot:PITA_08922
MKCSLEREPHLHVDEELLVPKDELQDVDQPQDEVHGVEETTHATPSIRGRKNTTEAERLAEDAEKGKYAREILKKFNMHGCKPVDTPLLGGWRKEDATSAEVVDAIVYRQLVGSLMYLVNIRPDICYAVNQCSQTMVKPTKLFWKSGKHVLRYLKGTSGYGLWYRQEDEVKLCGFMNSDWEGSPMDRKRTSGGIFSMGLTIVSWYNMKQRFVALSSAEAEYMAASLAACEAIWMRKILVGLFGSHLEPTVIYCDNHSCIKLSANPVFHDRSKRINIRYHHIRDCVQHKIMLLSYIPTED